MNSNNRDQGAWQDRVALACALQRAVALAGLRLLTANRDGGGGHGGELRAIPD